MMKNQLKKKSWYSKIVFKAFGLREDYQKKNLNNSNNKINVRNQRERRLKLKGGNR